MRVLAAAAVLSIVFTAPAFADDAPPAAPAPEAAKVKPAKAKGTTDGMVCTRETPTGSHFPVKVCKTAEQRKAERRGLDGARDSLQGASAGVVPN